MSRRHMDRTQLAEAARIVERLAGSNLVNSKRTKPEPAEPRTEGYRQTMHLGLDATDLENLDKIAERMRRDPIIGRLHTNIGREKAARYAIAFCVEHAPADATTG